MPPASRQPCRLSLGYEDAEQAAPMLAGIQHKTPWLDDDGSRHATGLQRTQPTQAGGFD